jgi:(2Fe-2S) ferredoxin
VTQFAARHDDRANADDRLQKIASALSIGGIERHIFLCAQATTPKCAPHEVGADSWRTLKAELKIGDLASAPPPWRGADIDGPAPETNQGAGRVLRSKVDCLRICEQGPIAVVYPDGVWYRNVTADVVRRIVAEHLVGGRVVEEHVFARDRLAGIDGHPQEAGN